MDYIYIYLICALMMPFLYMVDWRKLSHVLISLMAFVIYLYLINVTENYYFRIFVLYPIIYGLISIIGVNFERFSVQFWIVVGTCLLGVFSIMAVCLWNASGEFVVTGILYKYPPKLYYLAYTIGTSLLLLALARIWEKYRKKSFV